MNYSSIYANRQVRKLNKGSGYHESITMLAHKGIRVDPDRYFETKHPFSRHLNNHFQKIGGTMGNVQTEKLEIEQLIKRIETAENRHDIDAMLEELTGDPVLQLCGVPPVLGTDAMRQVYQMFFERFVSTIITSQQIFVSSSGEMAWDYGAYTNTLIGPDSRAIKEEGKYLGVYHKVNGTWKGAAYCITPNGN